MHLFFSKHSEPLIVEIFGQFKGGSEFAPMMLEKSWTLTTTTIAAAAAAAVVVVVAELKHSGNQHNDT